MGFLKRKNIYVATVYSRHSGREEKVGVWASNKEAAILKLEQELGKVISIERRTYIPADAKMEWSA